MHVLEQKTNTLRHAAAALPHRPVRTMDNVISNLGFGYTVSAGKPTERFKHEDDHIPHEGAPMKSQQGGEAVITQRIGT